MCKNKTNTNIHKNKTSIKMHACCCCLVTESCQTLSWPCGLRPPKILCPWDLLSKTLEWVDISFPKGSFPPRDGTHISCISWQIPYHWAIRDSYRDRRCVEADLNTHTLFILEYSQLTMLCQFQVNSKGTQPYIFSFWHFLFISNLPDFNLFFTSAI